MMRKFMTIGLLCLAFATFDAPTSAQERAISVTIGDSALTFDAPPFIENGRTLVPVRALAESLGFIVSWDGAEQRVTLQRDHQVIQLWVDTTRVTVDGTDGKIDVPAKIRTGRTFVPVRFVAEQLGAAVAWDDQAWAVRVTPAPAKGARALAEQTMKKQIANQKMVGSYTVTLSLGTLAFPIPIQAEAAVYESDLLANTSAVLPPLLSEKPFAQAMAVKAGQLYVQSSETAGTWTARGAFPPAAVQALLTGADGFTDANNVPSGLGLFFNMARGQETWLKQAIVKQGPKQTIGGVETTEVAISPSVNAYGQLPNQIIAGLGLTKEQVGAAAFQLDALQLRFWVDEATGQTHKSAIEIAVSSPSDPNAVQVKITLEGEVLFTPMTTPINFPELPAVVQP
jgi:hypothetical protein